MKSTRALLVSGAPFIHDVRSTARDAWLVSLLLLPVLVWEVLLSGWDQAYLALLAVGAALLADLAQSGLRRRFELDDGSAFLTGLLIALSLPRGLPLQAALLASAFAILVVKGAFGGLGGNWMNPALGGLAFAWLNWPKDFAAALGGVPASPLLPGIQSFVGGLDAGLTGLLNSIFFRPLGADLPAGLFQGLFGLKEGGILSLPLVFVLLASLALIGLGIIRWPIPAAMFLSFALPTWIFGALPSGGFFAGDPLGQSLGGSFLLVAFFMATDPVTSPSRLGRMLLFGGGAGLLCFALSSAGASLLAPLVAVLAMNALQPLIDEAAESLIAARRA